MHGGYVDTDVYDRLVYEGFHLVCFRPAMMVNRQLALAGRSSEVRSPSSVRWKVGIVVTDSAYWLSDLTARYHSMMC